MIQESMDILLTAIETDDEAEAWRAARKMNEAVASLENYHAPRPDCGR
jgi:hypothetical protein